MALVSQAYCLLKQPDQAFDFKSRFWFAQGLAYAKSAPGNNLYYFEICETHITLLFKK